MEFQHALLRFLDYGEIQPLGTERAEVRMTGASSLSLEELRERVYEPFFYRISGLELFLPSVEEREDKEGYIYYFLMKEGKSLGKEGMEISSEAWEALIRYPWEGNLREMRKAIHRAVVMSDGKRIEVEFLPKKIRGYKEGRSILSGKKPPLAMHSSALQSEEEGLDEFNLNNAIKIHIQKVLEFTKGNKSEAARLLGIPRTTLENKLKKLGLS